MKIVTMYLPQFHRVKENDEWWGEGFTEWTAVKKAETFFEGHYQPRIPLSGNYYDLLDKNTMVWQANLMNHYGVDGQCFYHYWFKDGRQILEKPAENLLKWKEIQMPFCFCWANEAWARTWSNLSSKNTWANLFEQKREKEDSGILLEQRYGSEKQWKKHFDYLLPFFRDKRYIKIEEKPVFLIYKTSQISCLGEMTELWRQWVREEGFPDIYLIGANSNYATEKYLDAALYHEPQYSLSQIGMQKKERQGILRVEYDDVWKELLCHRPVRKAFFEGFTSYDDTPRRGKGGTVVVHSTPEKFREYLAELIAKNVAAENELIFLNAWNEWGEGMYLEPDETYQNGFLEAIPYAKSQYKQYLQKYDIQDFSEDKERYYSKEIENLSAKNARYESYWRILDVWLRLKENKICLEDYFLERGMRTIMIYGAGMMGKHLIRELEGGRVRIVGAIDRTAEVIQAKVKLYSPQEQWPDVDAIVVTATYAFSEIYHQLKEKGYKNILSLEEIIMELT